jgi:hypothetical protein
MNQKGHVIDINRAILLNSINELRAWCTSIVAAQPDGTVLHSRNFDWLPLSFDLIHKVQYIKDGEIQFTGLGIAGTTGVYTGMKKGGAFAISNNSRRNSNNTSIQHLLENFYNEMQGLEESGYLIRDTLVKCDTFDCAYKMLRDTP